MRRLSLLLVGLPVALVFHGIEASSLAQSPDELRHYQFVQRLSTLRESGGIAGVKTDFRVMGTFDFLTGAITNRPPNTPELIPYASFENVEAWAAHPILAYVLPLDDVLNLSGLEGHPVRHPFPKLEAYRFEGKAPIHLAGDVAAKVQLRVARQGRWLYVAGETEPPCCDFFEYDIRAVAREWTATDRNTDGMVDQADLEILVEEYGSSTTGGDLLDWQREYDRSEPSLAEFAGMVEAVFADDLAGLAVPEPSGAALSGLLGALFFTSRRRR